jgi:transposase
MLYKYKLSPLYPSFDFNFLVVSLIWELDSRNTKWVMVIDNASIHRSQAYLLDAKKLIQILFLPLYSPNLIPVETLFVVSKKELRNAQVSKTNGLMLGLHYCIRKIKSEVTHDLYRKVLKEIVVVLESDWAYFKY